MNLDDVADHIRACRPDLAVRTLDPVGEGDFHRAYLLNGHAIVRIPKHGEAAAALAREACLLPRIATLLPVHVPVPEHASAGEAALSIHERITGMQLPAADWQRLAERLQVDLARQVGRFLAVLHSLDTELARTCEVPTVDHRQDAARLLEKTRRSAVAQSLPADLDACLRTYLDGGSDWRCQPAILNGDVSPEHVLLDEDRRSITGVIDWGDARIGDPARDFIFLYEDWGSDFLGHALDGYALESRERLLPRVLMHYVMDQLEWTLRAADAGRRAHVEHGVASLSEALDALRV